MLLIGIMTIVIIHVSLLEMTTMFHLDMEMQLVVARIATLKRPNEILG